MSILISRGGEGERFPIFPVALLPSGLMVENQPFELHVEQNGSSSSLDLDIVLNGSSLDRVTRSGHTFYPFNLEFYSGSIQLSFAHNGNLIGSIEIEVDPDVAKLTRNEYFAMISDIAAATLSLYRIGQASITTNSNFQDDRLDIVTLELIRAYLPSFESACARIVRRPARFLRSTQQSVDILSARKVSHRSIATAIRSQVSRRATVAERHTLPRLVHALGGNWIERINDEKREEHFDIYENRAISGFLTWVQRVLNDNLKRISNSSDQNTVFVKALRQRMRIWHTRLVSIHRKVPFISLAADLNLHSTSTFRLNPDYALAFSGMMAMKSGPNISGLIPADATLDKTYALYETWCYIGILEAAAQMYPECHSRVKTLLKGVKSPDTLGIQLFRGAGSQIELTDRVVLTYQHRFSTKPNADGTRTHLIEAIPDITISRTDESGMCIGIVVLDPKYRVGRGLIDSIRDMHVYRDSIFTAAGTPAIKGAAVIAPRIGVLPNGRHALSNSQPMAIQATPAGDKDVFQDVIRNAVKLLFS